MDAQWLPLQARVRKFGPKLLQLLAEWTETFPRDFQEESTIGHLKDVMGRIAPCDEVDKPSARGAPCLRPWAPDRSLFLGPTSGLLCVPAAPLTSALSAPSGSQALPTRQGNQACAPGLVS